MRIAARLAPLVLCLCAPVLGAAQGTQDGPAAIATVRTFKDLLRQPALTPDPKAGGEQPIHVGIEARSAPAGSGILIYALVENSDGIAVGGDTALGPLEVEVRREHGQAKDLVAVSTQSADVQRRGKLLFMKSIPLPEAGRYEVSVHAPRSDTVLCQTTVEAIAPVAGERAAQQFHAWTTFRRSGAQLQPLEAADGEAIGELAVCWHGAPALPRFDGYRGWLFEGADGEVEVKGDLEAKLPRLLPEESTEDAPRAGLAPAEKDRLEKLLVALGAEEFETREQASESIAALGAAVLPRLRQAHEQSEDAEVRHRAARLMERLAPPETLVFADGVLTVRLREEFDVSRPEDYFLVRWWLNGEPLQARGRERALEQMHQRFVPGHAVRFRLGLDDLELGPRDRLEVQLLYCPQGWEWSDCKMARLLAAAVRGEHAQPIPRLTTRVEIRLTDRR